MCVAYICTYTHCKHTSQIKPIKTCAEPCRERVEHQLLRTRLCPSCIMLDPPPLSLGCPQKRMEERTRNAKCDPDAWYFIRGFMDRSVKYQDAFVTNFMESSDGGVFRLLNLSAESSLLSLQVRMEEKFVCQPLSLDQKLVWVQIQEVLDRHEVLYHTHRQINQRIHRHREHVLSHQDYFNFLPSVNITELSEDGRDCAICMGELDDPVRLPCSGNHVFCRLCAMTAFQEKPISPLDQSNFIRLPEPIYIEQRIWHCPEFVSLLVGDDPCIFWDQKVFPNFQQAFFIDFHARVKRSKARCAKGQ
ncbi:hypothetical protein BJ878DRAFT_69514 [Calycina marina]|uniref:RING-type domain-containing protein n=1 Tax=Calycina marina TaxID=1763456 RepID=A0A9P7Z3X5_9HELO|nr:hypothetical protein BJ878DRAFT_69514 [Calycina marina]